MSIYTNAFFSSTANVLKTRQKQLEITYGELDFKSTAFALTQGKQEEVANRIGIELGINKTPVDNNLSFSRYVTASKSPDDLMFQGTDGYLYSVNFATGKASSIDEKSWIEENYQGLINPEDETDRNYDVIDFGQDSAEIINYSFNGVGDGCDKISTDANAFASSSTVSKWGDSIQWVYQEVDLKNPATSFFNNVKEKETQYINKNDADDIKQKLGYDAYINELILKAASAMCYNDNSGASIADYFNKKEEESIKADTELEAQLKAEEEEKAEAAEKLEQQEQEKTKNQE